MVLLLIFLLYLLPVIIIHVIGYIIWKRDPDSENQHTIGDLYEYYTYDYDEIVIIGIWCPAANIIILVLLIFACLYSLISDIRIK